MSRKEKRRIKREHTVCRTRLALAVVAVVVARDDRGVDVGRVGHGLAEAVAGERHFGCLVFKILEVFEGG
jgi:hypothetical protein